MHTVLIVDDDEIIRKQLEKELDEALEKETKESLLEWLAAQRMEEAIALKNPLRASQQITGIRNINTKFIN